jgi:uncharacterized protein DUF1761
MQFAGMNYIAIVIAAIAGFMFGGIYYTLLSQYWLKAVGLSKSTQERSSWIPYVLAAIANLVIAWVLAGVVGHLGAGQVTIKNAMISGAFIWAGFILTTVVVNNAFAMRKPMLSVIDAGHWLGTLLVIGAIIGIFGV